MRTKTFDELHEVKSFEFDELLEPYREGGTKDKPVRRSMGTMLDYLINKKKYPYDVVGGAIIHTLLQMKKGLVFKGDGATLPEPHSFHKPGSYGAPGRELVTYIRIICDKLLNEKREAEIGVFAARIIEAAKEKRTFRKKLDNWMRWGQWK